MPTSWTGWPVNPALDGQRILICVRLTPSIIYHLFQLYRSTVDLFLTNINKSRQNRSFWRSDTPTLMPTHTHTHTHSPALPSTASGWSDFRQVLLFGINLCLPLDCLPQEEQGQCLVLTVIEWPIYILLIDSEGFWWGFFFFFLRCVSVWEKEKKHT